MLSDDFVMVLALIGLLVSIALVWSVIATAVSTAGSRREARRAAEAQLGELREIRRLLSQPLGVVPMPQAQPNDRL